MKSISIESLTLRNFKKIKHLEIKFTDKTQINGDNGTGKTTVFDAFSWLLYGKNSHNESDFPIKTLDSENNPIHKLEHEVEGVFYVDDVKIVLKRLYFEKWVTKRGSDVEELKGHETKYFVDDVPLSKSDYELKVRAMVEENLSKMISNPDYFNGQIGWKERREILERMAGEVSDEEIIQGLGELSAVMELLQAGKNLEGERARINAAKKKLKDERDLIPSRIDEVDRMSEDSIDFDALEVQLTELNGQLKSVNEQIEDKNKALDEQRDNIALIKKDKFDKEQKLVELERAQIVEDESGKQLIERIQEKSNELNRLKIDKGQGDRDLSSGELRLESLNNERANLLAEYNTIKSSQAPDNIEGETACPTCKRELDNASEIKENLIANFNTEKALKISSNKAKGEANAKSIKDNEGIVAEIKTRISGLKLKIVALETEIEELEEKRSKPKAKPEPTEEMISLKSEIEYISIPEIAPVDTQELKDKREQLSRSIDTVKIELSKRDQIQKNKDRKEELIQLQRKLSQEISELEKIEFQIEAFNKAKITLIENRVNSMFKLVKFKMFEDQLNGGEAPTCVCLVDGVPYKGLNTASQINAGLDVIRSLQNHFEVQAPVFIDHRESVFEIEQMDCQVIGFMADVTAKELTVKHL